VPKILSFLSRELIFERTAGRVCFASFQDICAKNLSAADFLEIVKSFDIIILKDVPRMSYTQRNEARRFITLIDAIYDNKVALSLTKGKVDCFI
jgi:peroxisome-assembly ATPase